MIANLKREEKILPENAFEEKKKTPGLRFNPGLPLIGLRTTGPRIQVSLAEIGIQYLESSIHGMES